MKLECGIQRLQHAADGAVDQAVGLHLADVVFLDRAQGRGEHFVLVGDLILRDERAPADQPSEDGTGHHHHCRSRRESKTGHSLRL